MLVQQINYEDLDGKMQTRQVYFHLNKGDRARLSARHGGYGDYLKKIAEDGDQEAMIAEMEHMIRAAYGVRDGDRFNRSPEVVNDFIDSEAYGELLFQLCTDAVTFQNFFSSVLGVDVSIPSDLTAKPEVTNA